MSVNFNVNVFLRAHTNERIVAQPARHGVGRTTWRPGCLLTIL
jgi:hypothetical protein